ncbi:MAG TPA: DUF1501 domain-containing protein [Gemmatimonadales bacterium]|nr:DUF1501 domain-containing protein [Gemmatimonadales bacterium]
MHRRAFVYHGSFTALGLGLNRLAPLPWRRSDAAPRASVPKALVCLVLRGGVDGMSLVIPYGEPAYYRARPTVAVSPPGESGGALDLDGFFGLHPALEPLVPLYAGRCLAVIPAVGSTEVSRSHFDAQASLETGTPGVRSTPDGWLNRYLQQRGPAPCGWGRAVALAPRLPRLLEGGAPAVALGRWEEHAASAPQDSSLRAAYPGSALGRALRLVADLLAADGGWQVAVVDVGGWDSHVAQGGPSGFLAGRLADLGASLAAFTDDLGTRLTDVMVVTLTEFGRTVRENAVGGTDHGRGSAMLILGGGIRGGRVLGRWPGIRHQSRGHDDGVAVTTDVRDVMGEILARHLGAERLDHVFPNHDRGGPVGLFD